ncbi:hypothetical protein BKA70DRAFT_875702 [Coprinopsis sp. MPI-PUGE-AT-0042]|nr:hypothetical protein BKA70DRAFT_875702 [Coprinopsis sp. MPI-PUGE-AT-0042]
MGLRPKGRAGAVSAFLMVEFSRTPSQARLILSKTATRTKTALFLWPPQSLIQSGWHAQDNYEGMSDLNGIARSRLTFAWGTGMYNTLTAAISALYGKAMRCIWRLGRAHVNAIKEAHGETSSFSDGSSGHMSKLFPGCARFRRQSGIQQIKDAPTPSAVSSQKTVNNFTDFLTESRLQTAAHDAYIIKHSDVR